MQLGSLEGWSARLHAAGGSAVSSPNVALEQSLRKPFNIGFWNWANFIILQKLYTHALSVSTNSLSSSLISYIMLIMFIASRINFPKLEKL